MNNSTETGRISKGKTLISARRSRKLCRAMITHLYNKEHERRVYDYIHAFTFINFIRQ